MKVRSSLPCESIKGSGGEVQGGEVNRGRRRRWRKRRGLVGTCMQARCLVRRKMKLVVSQVAPCSPILIASLP
ncbi:Os09g0449700 [Oryza sativa Japonica Group]|uniref:Os09g0449700 protein n=1 Tax=Oryza sativa subsp. japonica TaxID=39947 RepID=A0A0P0XNS3_ORYSJ|nr:hypothetical protein EE612_048207 [Oryza sativa]BAT08376.1 Os09g0449700 [Oryza sativa Japonica Group]